MRIYICIYLHIWIICTFTYITLNIPPPLPIPIIGYMLVFCFLVVAVQLGRVLGVENSIGEVHSVVFRQCTVFVLTITCLVTVIITIGADVNNTFSGHM